VTLADWGSEPVNWVYAVLALLLVYSSIRVVTSQNVIRAALFLVGASAAMAGMFVLLSAEFVALALVLIYIGAVIVLFLFGVMITRAPMGRDVALDHKRKALPALVSLVLFCVLSWGSTVVLGESLLGRFVVPFEVVSFLLLAALIGGITIARKDLTPAEEETAGSI
jgi:NADH-quinone oxidoreductase subunit J